MSQQFAITKFNMLNYQKQSEPKFVEATRISRRTGKQETYFDVQNDAGYGFKMMTPPCNALFPHLGEGGNFGGKFSQTKETSKIVTNLVRTGADTQFGAARSDYFNYMNQFNDNVLTQMFNMDAGGTASAIMTKITKRYGKKKSEPELKEMGLKAFKKAAMLPLKTKDGEEQLVIKTAAFNKDLTPRAVRYVQPSGGQYIEMDHVPTIKNGALLSVPFMVRPFIMSKDKYGLTYTMITDLVVYSTGTGRPVASMEAIETAGRTYQLSLSEGKDDRTYLNINDEANCSFEMRPPSTEVVFSDLTGDGTFGKIPGVTQQGAKYNATTKEELSNPESVAFFDYVEKMQSDIIDYSIQHPKLLVKLKEESKEEADELVAETGENFDDAFRSIITDSFNAPVSKREEDEYRQLKFSQNVYSKNGNKNVLPMTDQTGATITVESVQRGALIAPVLKPSVYFMADGKFGMKLSISLTRGFRIDSNPESSVSGSSGCLYEVEEPPAKRQCISPSE